MLISFCTLTVTGQTVIKIPFKQPATFVVQPKEVNNSFDGNEIIEIGNDTEIYGGSGNYTFSWSLNGEIVGTQPTLTITKKGDYTLTINDGENCEATCVYHIDTDTGIYETSNVNIQIYPNPSDGMFYLQSSQYQEPDKAAIYDLNGILQNTNPMYPVNGKATMIDASGLSSGHYLLVLHYGKDRITKILIIR